MKSFSKKNRLAKQIITLLVISIVIVLAYVFLNFRIKALQHHPMLDDLLELLFLLAISYIVAYIFYYLTVQLEHDINLPSRREYVSRRLGRIISNSEFILGELRAHAKNKGATLDEVPTAGQLKVACSGVCPDEKLETAPTNGPYKDIDWYEAINIVFETINESKQEIILLAQDIDMELIGLLDELTDSQISRVNRVSSSHRIQDIGELDFEGFFHTIEKIKKYKIRLDKMNKKSRGRLS